MMLLVNELLQDQDTKDTFRIIWIDDGSVIAYLIDINDDKALPFKRSVAELIDEIIEEQLIKIKEDPFLFLRKAEESEKNLEMRDKEWTIIGNIVNDEPAIYEKNKRAEHIKNAMDNHNVSYPAVRKYLRKYWQRGKTKSSLKMKINCQPLFSFATGTTKNTPLKNQRSPDKVVKNTKKTFVPFSDLLLQKQLDRVHVIRSMPLLQMSI